MASVGGANIVNTGLVTLLDVANIKSFRGEPTTNLLYDNGIINWTVGNLTVTVSRTTIIENSVYRITSGDFVNQFTFGTFRFRVPLSKLTNGGTYTLSYKWRLISGGPTFSMNDWCDTNLSNVINLNFGDYNYASATGTRATYDDTFRFMDFNMSPFTTVEIYDVQLEQKNYSTPFVNGTRGTTVATGGGLFDISNNTRHGTLFGTTYDKNNQGVLDFDGTDDYFTIPQPNVTLTPNRWTISLWLKPGNQGSRFLTPQSNGIDQFLLYDNTNQRVQIAIATSADVNERTRGMGGNTAPRDRWTHISISLDDKVIKMYSNGVLTNTYTETLDIANWSGTWVIGQRGNSTFWFLGSISNLMVHNRVLSDDEILQNYNATKSRFNL
jgi:hypothetical protein